MSARADAGPGWHLAAGLIPSPPPSLHTIDQEHLSSGLCVPNAPRLQGNGAEGSGRAWAGGTGEQLHPDFQADPRAQRSSEAGVPKPTGHLRPHLTDSRCTTSLCPRPSRPRVPAHLSSGPTQHHGVRRVRETMAWASACLPPPHKGRASIAGSEPSSAAARDAWPPYRRSLAGSDHSSLRR